MGAVCFMFVFANLIFLSYKFSSAADSIALSKFLYDGLSLVSRDGSFELGFFSPGDSRNRYLGIWYKKIPVRTVVWVANRSNPINGTSGSLMINSTGNLVLLSQNNTVVWSSPNSTKEARTPILQLLDSGNLVMRDEKDGNSGIYLWQSFDYPTDTMLPGMKLGWNLRTGIESHLTSWKTPDDPSPGDFTWSIDLEGYPEGFSEPVLWKDGKKYCRAGPWNGLGTSGAPELKPNPVYEYNFVSDEEEVFYTYQLKNKSVISRVMLNQSNYLYQRYTWNEVAQSWMLYASVPRDNCDKYALCGVHGTCIIGESPICQCLRGFKPKAPEKWHLMDWSQGCVRNNSLSFDNRDGFLKFEGLKLPDVSHSWVNTSMNLNECREKCLANHSCSAYTNADIRNGGSGCVIWLGDLIDIRQFPSGGQDLCVRMSASDLVEHKGAKGGSKMKLAVILTVVGVFAIVMLLVSSYIRKRRAKIEGQREDLELPLFDLATITNATRNFSNSNKLGEGGFGPVYKGSLSDGVEIAVKRLSSSSGQGLNEFKNEVILIAKLQHRNLVRLLGCCIQGEETMLVYEYLPNKSLDYFIFNPERAVQLDWSKRFHIICGIARGILYLHQDSRLRIIHRDLKASNVLLDSEMNPKISDFGLAKTFGGDQSEGNTKRVVGTYGYMAPEYAIHGLFSVKSDVFSFGILLLEIISGKRNRGVFHPKHNFSLIGHAWKLWKEDKLVELIDESLGETYILPEVMRCTHIGLLCVQQHPDNRPVMSSVVLMLGGEGALPDPKAPGYFLDRDEFEADTSATIPETNQITITMLEGR